MPPFVGLVENVPPCRPRPSPIHRRGLSLWAPGSKHHPRAADSPVATQLTNPNTYSELPHGYLVSVSKSTHAKAHSLPQPVPYMVPFQLKTMVFSCLGQKPGVLPCPLSFTSSTAPLARKFCPVLPQHLLSPAMSHLLHYHHLASATTPMDRCHHPQWEGCGPCPPVVLSLIHI